MGTKRKCQKVRQEVSNKGDKELVRKIETLHSEIMGFYKKSITSGIELGELLATKKAELGHNHWIKWVKNNLPFSERTASNYMKLYRHQDVIKKANISDLQAAYKLLTNPDNYARSVRRSATKERREEFADRTIKFPNSKGYINAVHNGDNYSVMQNMINNGMAGQYSGVLTSPNYNANFFYGKGFDDNKPYKEYIDDLAKVFPLYSKLLRPGGRIFYVIASITKNKNRNEGEDYNYPLVVDLINKVKEVAPCFLLFNNIIWDKGAGKNFLNKEYGTFCDPKRPLTRSVHEHVIVWSNKQFDLENIEGTEPDITPEEFEEWSWSIWRVHPYSRPNNPHPCSCPPRLVERILKFYSYPNDLILDPYAGVSTTAQVCKKLNRRYTMIELNPNYCQESERLLKSA